jgi:glutathione S-transferase
VVLKALLIGVPSSHPTATAELSLERKGIPYRRIDLVPGVSRALLRVLGFDGARVPALWLDGQRLQGSRTITRALEALQPEPHLFPVDPDARAAVESAERWGEEVLQDVPRRLTWGALLRDRSGIGSLLEGSHTGVPSSIGAPASIPVIPLSARLNRVSDATLRADLERLPDLLDRVDELIADGVIGGQEPNAADFQIAPSVRLLWCHQDFRPAIEGRPAGELAERVAGRLHGDLAPSFPAQWLAPFRARTGTPA